MNRIVKLAVLTLAVAGPSVSASGASFDCASTLSPTEATICSHSELSTADDNLATLYSRLRNTYSAQADTLRSAKLEQKNWLDGRDACAADAPCILEHYKVRTAELQALLAAPPGGDETSANAVEDRVPAEVVPSAEPPAPGEATPTALPDNRDDTEEDSIVGDAGILAGWGLALLIGGLLYFIPSLISLLRGHAYVGVIFVVNIFAAWTGFGWLVILVWSIWPKEKSLIDPAVGNVTGTGQRNAGDTLGEADFGRARGFQREANRHSALKTTSVADLTIENLTRLATLRDNGLISPDEFTREKQKLLN